MLHHWILRRSRIFADVFEASPLKMRLLRSPLVSWDGAMRLPSRFIGIHVVQESTRVETWPRVSFAS